MPRALPAFVAGLEPGSSRECGGAALVAVVDGFAELVERRSSEGRDGAEELAVLAARAFAPIVAAAKALGGDALSFEGDAATAAVPLPPGGRVEAARRFVEAINRDPDAPPLRAALASGTIVARVIEAGGLKAFVPGGDALRSARALVETAAPGRLVVPGGPELSRPARHRFPHASRAFVARGWIDPVAPGTAGRFERATVAVVRLADPSGGSFVDAMESALEAGGRVAWLDDERLTVFFDDQAMSRDGAERRAASFLRGLRRSATGLAAGFAAGFASGAIWTGTRDETTGGRLGPFGTPFRRARALASAAGPGECFFPASEIDRWTRLVSPGRRIGIDLSGIEGGLDAVEAVSVPSLAATRALPFVGRTEELSAIVAALGPDSGPATRVEGPEGSGKTRLVEEAAKSAGRVLVRLAPDPVNGASLSAFARALESAVADADPDAAPRERSGSLSRAEFAALVVLAADGEPVPAEFRACPDEAKAAFLARGFAAWLRARYPGKSLAIFLDDADDFRPADVAVASALASIATREGWPVVVAGKDTSGLSMDARLVSLGPMDEASAMSLALSASPDLDDSSVRAVVAVAGGKPSLLSLAARSAAFRHASGFGARESSPPDGPTEDAVPPGSLSETELAREVVSSLAPETREALGFAAAVLGRAFSRDEVERRFRALGKGSSGLLEPAIEAGILRETKAGELYFVSRASLEAAGSSASGEDAPETRVFALDLAEADISRRRAAMPGLVRRARRAFRDDPELGPVGAEGFPRLVAVLSRATGWALEYWRLDEALDWARELASIAPDATTVAEARLAEARALAALCRDEDCVVAYRAASREAERAGNPAMAATATRELVRHALSTGDLALAEGLEPALRARLRDADDQERAQIRQTLSACRHLAGDPDAARNEASAQLAAAERARDRDAVAAACANVAAIMLASPRDDDRPVEWLERALATFSDSPDPRVLRDCYYYLALALGRGWDAAVRYAGLAIELSSSIGDVPGLLHSLARRADALSSSLRFDEAIADYAKVLSGAESEGLSAVVAEANAGLGYALLHSGRADEALPRFTAAWKAARDSDDPTTRSFAAWEVARISLEKGNARGALAFLKAEAEDARRREDALSRALALGYVGMSLGDCGRFERALAAVDRALELLSDYEMPCRVSRLLLEKARLELCAVTARGETPEAGKIARVEALCDRAIERAARVKGPAATDVPWNARVVAARARAFVDPGAVGALLASTAPESLCARDRALYLYESSRVAATDESRREALASAIAADRRAVARFARIDRATERARAAAKPGDTERRP